MTTEYERTTVNTDAGDYVIVQHYDTDAPTNPLLEYDHEGMQLYVFYRESFGWNVVYDGLDGRTVAGNALGALVNDHGGYRDMDDVERRMNKWMAIARPDGLTFHAGQANVEQSTIYYLAVVDGTYPDAAKAVDATMREYADWAAGYVYGYTVESPAGDDVDSCWGFIGNDGEREMVSDANAFITYDAAQRVASANLAGSGIVGLI